MKLYALLSVPLVCLASIAAQADDKWSVTTAFDMPGMPFQMPPRTQEVCVAPGKQADEKALQSNKDCTTSNIQRSGNTMSFHMECHGHMSMVGDGTITHAADSYNGDVKMTGNFGGQGSNTVHVQYSGRKIGSCDGSKEGPAAALSQYKAQMGSTCATMLDNMVSMGFTGPHAMCADQKPQFCAKVQAYLAKGNTPDGLKTIMHDRGDWKDLAAACDVDADALAKTACDSAKAKKDWINVADVCPAADGEALAEQNCTGRSYSVVMTGEYGALCQRYSSKVHVTGQNGGSGSISDVGAKAMDGINKLRGLFGH